MDCAKPTIERPPTIQPLEFVVYLVGHFAVADLRERPDYELTKPRIKLLDDTVSESIENFEKVAFS